MEANWRMDRKNDHQAMETEKCVQKVEDLVEDIHQKSLIMRLNIHHIIKTVLNSR